jgi:hypothetical protein
VGVEDGESRRAAEPGETRGGTPGQAGGAAEPGETRGAAPRRGERPLPQPMPKRNVAIMAVFVGVLYAAGMIARGAIAPGIVGGILAGILMYLVLREIGQRQQRRIHARERSKAP